MTTTNHKKKKRHIEMLMAESCCFVFVFCFLVVCRGCGWAAGVVTKSQHQNTSNYHDGWEWWWQQLLRYSSCAKHHS